MTPKDAWDKGDLYEPYIGRWSTPVAREFVRWLALPSGAAWLDFGCGTGALAREILALASPRLVVGCDRSPGFVEFARGRVSDPRVEFRVAELPDLPGTDGGFDACVSGLVLNFLPDPAQGLAALSARTRPGGVVAAYVWDYGAGMELIRAFFDAAVELDPAARELDEGVRFPLCRPEPLRALFSGATLGDVEVRPIDVPTVFSDFDDYWKPFLGGQGPAPGYAMSLDPERRGRLREAIRQRISPAAGGPIALTARAWAVRGRVAPGRAAR